MKLKDLLLSLRSANKLAVVDGDIQMTYADLYREACRCQRMIRSVTESRAHVALLFPNSASYVAAYCGVLLADCVAVPIYHKATQQEIAHTVDTCDVQILLTNSEYSAKLQGITFQNRVSVINTDRFSRNTFHAEKPVAQIYSPAEVSELPAVRANRKGSCFRMTICWRMRGPSFIPCSTRRTSGSSQSCR